MGRMMSIISVACLEQGAAIKETISKEGLSKVIGETSSTKKKDTNSMEKEEVSRKKKSPMFKQNGPNLSSKLSSSIMQTHTTKQAQGIKQLVGLKQAVNQETRTGDSEDTIIKPKMHFLTEGECPMCVEWQTETLPKLYSDPELLTMVDFSIVPFGNAYFQHPDCDNSGYGFNSGAFVCWHQKCDSTFAAWRKQASEKQYAKQLEGYSLDEWTAIAEVMDSGNPCLSNTHPRMQHGKEEANVDKYKMCTRYVVLEDDPYSVRHLWYANCIARTDRNCGNPESSMETCTQELEIDTQKVKDCANGPKGLELRRVAAVLTPEVDSVPWVKINDYDCQGGDLDCIMQTVCPEIPRGAVRSCYEYYDPPVNIPIIRVYSEGECPYCWKFAANALDQMMREPAFMAAVDIDFVMFGNGYLHTKKCNSGSYESKSDVWDRDVLHCYNEMCMPVYAEWRKGLPSKGSGRYLTDWVNIGNLMDTKHDCLANGNGYYQHGWEEGLEDLYKGCVMHLNAENALQLGSVAKGADLQRKYAHLRYFICIGKLPQRPYNENDVIQHMRACAVNAGMDPNEIQKCANEDHVMIRQRAAALTVQHHSVPYLLVDRDENGDWSNDADIIKEICDNKLEASVKNSLMHCTGGTLPLPPQKAIDPYNSPTELPPQRKQEEHPEEHPAPVKPEKKEAPAKPTEKTQTPTPQKESPVVDNSPVQTHQEPVAVDDGTTVSGTTTLAPLAEATKIVVETIAQQMAEGKTDTSSTKIDTAAKTIEEAAEDLTDEGGIKDESHKKETDKKGAFGKKKKICKECSVDILDDKKEEQFAKWPAIAIIVFVLAGIGAFLYTRKKAADKKKKEQAEEEKRNSYAKNNFTGEGCGFDEERKESIFARSSNNSACYGTNEGSRRELADFAA